MGRNEFIACFLFFVLRCFFHTEPGGSHKGSWWQSLEMALLGCIPALAQIYNSTASLYLEVGAKELLISFVWQYSLGAFMTKKRINGILCWNGETLMMRKAILDRLNESHVVRLSTVSCSLPGRDLVPPRVEGREGRMRSLNMWSWGSCRVKLTLALDLS